MASYYQDGQHRLKNTDVEQGRRFDELTLRGLYESPHLESDCLGTRLDNAGELLIAARTEPEYDDFGLEVEGTRRQEIDSYWVNASLRTTQARDVDPIDLGDEDLTGLPLESQERLHGLRNERKRQREKALAASVVGLDRETRTREDVVAGRREQRHEQNDRLIGPRGITHHDPLEGVDEDIAEQVRDAAVRLAGHFRSGPDVDVLENAIGRKVARGQSVYTALSNVQEQFYQEAGVIQPISTVPVIPSKYNVEADIQGEVTTLWYPKSNNQQQVGIIKDDSGTIKFTVWTRSNQSVILHEGDIVRIVGGKVGKYNGQATLAADSETRITILESGDGPAPRGDIARVFQEESGEPSTEEETDGPTQVHKPCAIPAPGTPGVEKVSRPVHAPTGRLDESQSDEFEANHWLKSTEIYEEGGAVPLPEWWRNQDNVVSVVVDEDDDQIAINEAIEDVVSTTPLGTDDGERTSTSEEVPDGGRRLWALIRDEELFGASLEEDTAKESTPESQEKLVGISGSSPIADTSATSDLELGLPSTTSTCPDCSHERAHYRLVQLRSTDEPPTRLLSCVSCGRRWREDS
ncbi:hypothetical protein C475_22394 [Halosimplex carlsbadense 2-9-1]|uniref:TFIIS-type domain-containing protein n=1 Tax=Halosimplex carlsbadense 2-9-1 TaxID=797114 RepID=M0C928_9EURY|nr:hypothetical protein [Halosimplex carlsbadense]ELZ19740.1 hypothetical protein C475_22394 [Halosimplex carlsbadense 2-9-1]